MSRLKLFFYKRDAKLFFILMGSISTGIFTSIDTTIDIHLQPIYTRIFGQILSEKKTGNIANEFHNSKITNGEDATIFYRKLLRLFNKL